MEHLSINEYKRIARVSFIVIIASLFAIISQLTSILWLNSTNTHQVIGICIIATIMVAASMIAVLSKSHASLSEMRKLAFVDELTGLINRRCFNATLTTELAKCKLNEGTLALLSFDLDRFKGINDSHGHEAGDAIICQFGQRIQNLIRKHDVLCRISGDEFVLLVRNVNTDKEIEDIGERLLVAMQEPFKYNGRFIKTTASMGAVTIKNGECSAASALRMADVALLESKEKGRNQLVQFNDRMAAQIKHRDDMEIKLREAIANKTLSLRYQPIISNHDGSIAGVEALIRWIHKDDGEISPAEFLPLAAELALMEEIGDFILEKACEEIGPLEHMRLAVNIHTVQFMRDNFIERLQSVLKKTGFDPARLELEITQELLNANPNAVKERILTLNELGVRFALDDFGTGESSVTFLSGFNLDRVKLDREFIRDHTKYKTSMLSGMITLARSLSSSVTVEGVETRKLFETLNQIGCDELQGFYFSRPLTAGDLMATSMLEDLKGKTFIQQKTDSTAVESQRVA